MSTLGLPRSALLVALCLASVQISCASGFQGRCGWRPPPPHDLVYTPATDTLVRLTKETGSIDGAKQAERLKELLVRFADPKGTTLDSSLTADDKARIARETVDSANLVFDDGSYDLALNLYKRAYALRPSDKLFYNLAVIYEHLHDPVNAVRFFQAFLSKGVTTTVVPREKIQAEIDRLLPYISTVTLQSDRASATLWIDDVVVGTGTIVDYPVNVGPHTVRVGRDYEWLTKDVFLHPSKSLTLYVGFDRRSSTVR